MPLRLVLDPASPDPAAISRAVDALLAGGVVAYPTDTFYGLAADPRDLRGARRIFELKSRGASVALPFIAADLAQAAAVGEFNDTARRLARRWWPGPLTLVVFTRRAVGHEESVASAGERQDQPAASAYRQKDLSAALGGRDTVAVRVPDHTVARALARALGFCVTSTSANVSSYPPSGTADEVARALPLVDVILDGGPSPRGGPSTIVAVRGETIALVREGVVPWERVLESLQ